MQERDDRQLELNDLLKKAGLDSKTVLVLRHRPTERELRKVFPWLAAERPETYNAYQQTHGPKVEHAMQGCICRLIHRPRGEKGVIYRSLPARRMASTDL
jgi:hypothetical protein